MEFYNNLRISIVKQAVDDYVLTRKRIKELRDVDNAIERIFKEDMLRKNRRCYTYADAEQERLQKIEVKEYECAAILRFIRSTWFKQLCGIDPEYLIRRLKEKCKKYDEV